MTASWSTIDCDVHVNVPSMQALLPHLDEYWRDSVVDRGMNSLESISYPPNAPLTARPDWRGKGGAPADTLDALRTHALDRWSIDVGLPFEFNVPIAGMSRQIVFTPTGVSPETSN